MILVCRSISRHGLLISNVYKNVHFFFKKKPLDRDFSKNQGKKEFIVLVLDLTEATDPFN